MTLDAAPARRWHPSSPRYRTVAEPCILDLLLLCGWAFEVRNDPDTCRAEAIRALNRLVALGLPFEAGPPRRFDPAEVVNFLKWEGLHGRDAFWRARFVATGRRLARQLGGPGFDLSPRRFDATLRRTFNIAHVAPGRRLRLRLPLPIEDAALCELRHDLSQAGGTGFDIAAAPGRIEATGPAPDSPTLSLTLRLSFLAGPGRPDASTPPDRALTLHPDEGAVQVTPRVRALACQLAGGGRSDAETVGRFWDFMLDHLCCGVVHYDQVGPVATDWILDHGWFDCHLGSALLVALCRASAIPARLVGGHVLAPAAPTPHYWAELWLDGRGWTSFDLLAWDLSAGGQDEAWRRCSYGQVDYRMKTTRLPEIFTGPMTIRLPAQRHLLMRQTRHGMEAGYYALADGALVFRDEFCVSFAA